MKSKELTPGFTHMQKLSNSNVISFGPGDDDDALPEDIEEEWIPQEAW